MTDELIRRIVACAATAPSADNGQPWLLHWDGLALEIHFQPRAAAADVFGPNSHGSLLAIGGLLENLLTILAANGIPSPSVSEVDLVSGTPYFRVHTGNHTGRDFSCPASITRRHTNRFPFLATDIRPEYIDQIRHLREGSARIVTVQGSETKHLAAFVRVSSEARFSNRALHEWLIQSLRFTPGETARGDGLDITTLYLPPGGRSILRFLSPWRRMHLLNRVGAHKFLALEEARLVSAGPALVCIAGRKQPRDIIDAGRLMLRAWMQLNTQNIAVHPYYVIVDQLARLDAGTATSGFEGRLLTMRNDLGALLGLAEDEQLHMMLRIGHSAVSPPRSRRLPLESVFTTTASGHS